MACSVCGSKNVVRERRGLPYTYKTQTIEIPAVLGEHCRETVVDSDELVRVSALMLDHNQATKLTAE